LPRRVGRKPFQVSLQPPHVNIEPIGGAAVEEDGLIDEILKTRLILGENLLISDAKLGLIFLSLFLPVRI